MHDARLGQGRSSGGIAGINHSLTIRIQPLIGECFGFGNVSDLVPTVTYLFGHRWGFGDACGG